MDKPLADVIRDCIDLGLRDLKSIGYDTIGAIADAARQARESKPQAGSVIPANVDRSASFGTSLKHTTDEPESAIAAEGTAGYPKITQKVSYGSSPKRRK